MPFGSQMPYFDILYLCRPAPGGTAAKAEKQTCVFSTLIPFRGRVSWLWEFPVCLPYLPDVRLNHPAGIT